MSNIPKAKRFKKSKTRRSYFTRSKARRCDSNEQTFSGLRQKQFHILTLPFFQKLKVLSFLNTRQLVICSTACRGLSGDLLQRALSSIKQNLFLRYRNALTKRVCGQRNYLAPNEVAQQFEIGSNGSSAQGGNRLCSARSALYATWFHTHSLTHNFCRNICRLSRKLFLNARGSKASKAQEGKEGIKLEEDCLRKAVVTWFNVNHDYFQEKSVCAPGDYIQKGKPRMKLKLHWRKLIVEWLFEVCKACALHDALVYTYLHILLNHAIVVPCRVCSQHGSDCLLRQLVRSLSMHKASQQKQSAALCK